MEPEWTKQIESVTICNFFYVLAIAYAVLGGLGVLNAIVGLGSKLPGALKLFMTVFSILLVLVVVTFYFFMYILCDRALLAKKEEGFLSFRQMRGTKAKGASM